MKILHTLLAGAFALIRADFRAPFARQDSDQSPENVFTKNNEDERKSPSIVALGLQIDLLSAGGKKRQVLDG